HQGVEFNNPDGTPVHAIGDGVVVFAGPAEQGANTVAIRHTRRLKNLFVYSVYYHNTTLLTSVGHAVKAGDVIATVGNTGRATNDHLHLEVHASPVDSVALIVDPNERYPRYTVNPELWIRPLPGTGIVAGQVWDAQGRPVPQARVYGLMKAEPQETPFSYAETYGEHNHPDPAYREHFAVSDVESGDYTLAVVVEGKRLTRRIRVAAGRLGWVVFGSGGYVVLVGSAARHAVALAGLMGGIHFVGIDAPPDVAELPVLSLLACETMIPLRRAMARAVVVGPERASPPWLSEALRVLLR